MRWGENEAAVFYKKSEHHDFQHHEPSHKKRLPVQHSITFGRDTFKRVDIAAGHATIFGCQAHQRTFIIVEVKAVKPKDCESGTSTRL